MYWFLLLIPLLPFLLFIYRWVKISRIDKKVRAWQKLSSPDQPEQPPRPEGFELGDRTKGKGMRPIPYLFGFLKVPKRMGPRPAGMMVYDELTRYVTVMSFRPWVRAMHGFKWIEGEEENPNPTLNVILISLLMALVCSVLASGVLIGVMYLLNFMWAYKVLSALSIFVIMLGLILYSTYRND